MTSEPVAVMPHFAHALYITRDNARSLVNTKAAPAQRAANTQFDKAPRTPAEIYPMPIKTSGLETLHVLVWTDPANPARSTLGIVHETWKASDYLNGWPAVALYALHSFDSREHALAARDRLARNKTFSQIMVLATSDAVVSRDPADMPFARPAHWRRAAPRPARPAIV